MTTYYKPILKEGTHLALSKNDNGRYRGSLLSDDTNQLEGQAEWEMVEIDDHPENNSELVEVNNQLENNTELVEVDDKLEDNSELITATKITLAAFGISILAVGAIKSAPYIKGLVDNKIIPTINKAKTQLINNSLYRIELMKNKLSRTTKAEQLLDRVEKEKSDNIELSTLNNTTIDSIDFIKDTIEFQSDSINIDEIQQHMINLRGLIVLIADEIINLSTACNKLNDMSSESFLEIQDTIRKLTSEEVLNSIKLLLECKDTTLLDNFRLMILSEFIAGNFIIDGKLIPIDCYRIKA